jgi:lysozyme
LLAAKAKAAVAVSTSKTQNVTCKILNMKTGEKGVSLIKHYESFFANPYLCPAGKPTIGYGTTIYPNGKPVTLRDKRITEPEAVELLQADLKKFETAVTSLLIVPVTQWQFDALVSFAYNVGSDIDADTIAEGLGDSTLLKLVNKNIMAKEGWKKAIAIEFNKWIRATVKGKRKILPGLVARRNSESLLFTDNVLKFFN